MRAFKRKKILLFTDSRGQHKPAGQDYFIFGERLQHDTHLDADIFLCPMKWTTTLDLLEMFDAQKLKSYDAIILWTGIVDWSPRPVSSAVNDLYDNRNISNLDGVGFNTRDYSKKVVNNKRRIFDSVFGTERMRAHFAAPFETVYAGERTSNMYSLKMAHDLLRRLSCMLNLIYINANRFVPGWEGNFKKNRPENISLTHAYSDLFTDVLSGVAKVIDLRKWSNDEVKAYTCDNIHVTRAGSDYIYEEIMRALDMQAAEVPATNVSWSDASAKPNAAMTDLSEFGKGLATSFNALAPLERFIGAKQRKLLDAVKAAKHLATLIIGFRLRPGDEIRERNLMFILDWLEYHYSGLFDVLLVEQDSCSRFDLAKLKMGKHVRHEFIYNPGEYNRGWGYNAAVQHFCPESKVVALMDTDVLTGANFVREIIDCHSKYDVISPYQNIYYTNETEAVCIYETYELGHLTDAARIKNPVTVAGGILVASRDVYLALKGFEQYVGYGCEDRALDVTVFNHLPHDRIRIAPVTYVHLYHPRDSGSRSRFKEIYAHLIENYGCKYEPSLEPFDFIHKACSHVGPQKTLQMMRSRADGFAELNLYRWEEAQPLNGSRTRGVTASCSNVIYPPDFTSLREYKEKEVYKAAPAPDSDELASFYNAYKGKRCFIIGNGPSLNKHDLSLLRDEYTFGVNSFYYKTRETGFVPFFYVVEDSSVMKENIEEIRAYNAPFKFFPTIYKKLHPKRPNTLFFRMNRSFYEKSSPNYVVPRFSTDASDVLYCGQSVTYINLQLAYFMGFEEVYLIGMDFSYKILESHKRTGDVLLSDTDDPNHFHKDYFGKGKTWKDPKLDRVLMNYKMANLVYSCVGRHIYNATIGGNLELFERVDFNSLFLDQSASTRPTQEGYISTTKFNYQTSQPRINVDSKVREPIGIDEATGSISAANKLFSEGKYSECVTMCDRLFKLRGLRMYKHLARAAHRAAS